MVSTLKSLELCMLRSHALLLGVLLLGTLPSHAAATTLGKYKITKAEKAACIGDATRFCAYTYPDEDKLLSCMRLNHEALSGTCRTTFDAGVRRRRL